MNKKNEDNTKLVIGCVTIVIAIVLFIAAAFLSPLFLMWGWNLGVLALFPALPTMGYWTAFWISVFLGAIGHKFKSTINTAKINNLFD